MSTWLHEPALKSPVLCLVAYKSSTQHARLYLGTVFGILRFSARAAVCFEPGCQGGL